MEGHKERAHAILSASGSHRWLECTASARLEELFPDVDTIYSDEGTRAHELAENALSFYQVLGFRPDLEELFKDKPVMLQELKMYLNYVMDETDLNSACYPDTELLLEQRLDFSHIVPEGFGTGDAILIYGDTIHVIDLKFGKGVRVDAEDNSQMRLYAVGAIKNFGAIYDFKNIKMTIVQPRLDHISTEEMTVEELSEWAEKDVRPRAQAAFSGSGQYQPGEHCRFCKAAGLCKARMEETMELAELITTGHPDLITTEQIAAVLDISDKAIAFFKAVNERATSLMLEGVKIPGYKVVEGRTVRKITDQDGLVEALKGEGFAEAMLFERKLLNLTSLEKVVGKTKFNTVAAPFLTKPEGAPTIVPESDKRPAITAGAHDDFIDL